MVLEDIKMGPMRSQQSRINLKPQRHRHAVLGFGFDCSCAVCNMLVAGLPAVFREQPCATRRDLYQRMEDSEEGDLTDNDQTEGMRLLKKVYPLLLTQDEDTQGTLRTAWVKGTKDSSQHEKISNMANDIKSAVLKLAAAEKLITHSFVKSDQNTQKPAKRACFWKYCVTK